MAQLFKALSQDTDLEWVFLDASYVRAHPQGHGGAATPGDEAIGKSRGGNTTQIHLAPNSDGLPVHFERSAGQVSDISGAASLLEGTPISEYVIADKGYDNQALREVIEARGAQPVIPRRKHNTRGNDGMDWCLAKYRHLIENKFARIKPFRAIATRYDKPARNFASMLALAFVTVWLPM